MVAVNIVVVVVIVVLVVVVVVVVVVGLFSGTFYKSVILTKFLKFQIHRGAAGFEKEQKIRPQFQGIETTSPIDGSFMKYSQVKNKYF